MSMLIPCHPIAKTDIVRSEGTRLFDRAGRTILDFESGVWCTALGHSHPRVAQRLAEQAATVANLGARLTSAIADEAAVALLARTPLPDGRAVFLSSGSEAVELAIRIALQTTGRRKLVTFTHSYLSAYAGAENPHGSEWVHLDLARPDLSQVDLREVAALVMEPVLASGGILLPPAEAVASVAEQVRAAGGLLVVDEVTTGLGRTGRWLGIEHLPVEPDLIAFGKALGNGYPVSAVAARRSVAEALGRTGFTYIQSHQNDPLGCAVALEVLAVLDSEQLIQRAAETGAYLGVALRRLQAAHSCVAEARGVGLMWGLELSLPPENVERIWSEMLALGFHVGIKAPRSLLRFLPPLVVTTSEIDAMVEALHQVLGRYPSPIWANAEACTSASRRWASSGPVPVTEK